MLVKINDEIDIKSKLIKRVYIKKEDNLVKVKVSTDTEELDAFCSNNSFENCAYAHLLKTLIGMQMSYKKYFPYNVDYNIRETLDDFDMDSIETEGDFIKEVSMLVNDFADDLDTDLS